MRYLPLDNEDRAEMLGVIGVVNVEDLFEMCSQGGTFIKIN